MKRRKRVIILLCIAFIIVATGLYVADKWDLSKQPNMQDGSGNSSPITQGNDKTEGNKHTQNDEQREEDILIDLQHIKPDETGGIMIVMFHNFVETFIPKPYDKGEFTTTLEEFRQLLQVLYDKKYRLISMKDYLDNNINVAAGCTPMIFTFDDGTSGQFNLVERDGELVVNSNTAVGIMEEFYKSHPDFGLSGVFYVNLGNSTFEGKGSVEQRLKYLVERGFEIGNHTYSHNDLSAAKSEEDIQKYIGRNQQAMQNYITRYTMETFSLPFGGYSARYKYKIMQGEYEDVKYENRAILLVGANPAHPTTVNGFDSFNVPRVRSNGIQPVNYDLQWWLDYFDKNPGPKYISDGRINVITVPDRNKNNIVQDRLAGKKLVVY